MRGLDPRIHRLRRQTKPIPKRMDCRVKPGNDDSRAFSSEVDTGSREENASK
jgi:hypothetical protein